MAKRGRSGKHRLPLPEEEEDVATLRSDASGHGALHNEHLNDNVDEIDGDDENRDQVRLAEEGGGHVHPDRDTRDGSSPVSRTREGNSEAAEGISGNAIADGPDVSVGRVQSFASLGVSPWLVTACSEVGLRRPTAVQAACIPATLDGRNVLGVSQTGSGKTAAFAIPILQVGRAG